jgi:hypothetical protein
MRKTTILLGILIILTLLCGCKDTTAVEYDKTRINNILYNIERAFNDHDIDALMSYYHVDFLHKGQSRWAIREVWLNRMGEYLLIDFQNISISVHDDNAVVSFTMKLIKQNETVFSDEPDAHGDASYFFYDNYDWRVYGNQLYSR